MAVYIRFNTLIFYGCIYIQFNPWDARDLYIWFDPWAAEALYIYAIEPLSSYGCMYAVKTVMAIL